MFPDNAPPTMKKESRKATEVMTEIETVIGSIDSIATSDVFKLAGLIREYGQVSAGEVVGPLMAASLTSITKPPKDAGEPWREGR